MRAKGVVIGIAAALLLGRTAFWAPTMTEAAVVRGSAAIVNGDMDKARREAKEDAMRNCIEQEVGTHVTSSTETSLGMVVSDRIIAQADGYVSMRGNPKEWQSGGIYFVEMDLVASAQRIAVAIEDVACFKNSHFELTRTSKERKTAPSYSA